MNSDYHRDALLNSFIYAVNHSDGKLYEKANKKKVSIKNTHKGKILFLLLFDAIINFDPLALRDFLKNKK